MSARASGGLARVARACVLVHALGLVPSQLGVSAARTQVPFFNAAGFLQWRCARDKAAFVFFKKLVESRAFDVFLEEEEDADNEFHAYLAGGAAAVTLQELLDSEFAPVAVAEIPLPNDASSTSSTPQTKAHGFFGLGSKQKVACRAASAERRSHCAPHRHPPRVSSAQSCCTRPSPRRAARGTSPRPFSSACVAVCVVPTFTACALISGLRPDKFDEQQLQPFALPQKQEVGTVPDSVT